MTTRVSYADNGCLQSLPLVSTTLKSHIVDLTVSHTLTQVYNNSSARDISEAHYTFPLYESSSVTDFQALIGEKIIRGVVKARAEAKAIYEAAKSAGKVTALFSQDTSEVFTTSVGNIPAGGSVVVVIKYVHELKQDIEVDGVKLVIPAIIAPKYGTAPVTPGLDFGDRWRTCWDTFSRNIQDIGNAQNAGISLSITATMSGPIRGVTSPSHPISIGLGSHSSSDDADFNPMKAHATLALASTSLTSLDRDFSLLISTNNIGDPRAFLALHPTLKDTSTLMVTMVPRFALPSQGHEIIFVVDRSGSMGDKIGTVRDALQLFLASLPVGLHFNICSFGSKHSFLWPQSQEYSEASLNVAKAHVRGMDSNMGGTEILAAIIDTMRARRSGMRTEILILTDGEVWNSESMFRFIGESSEDGNVRFFSLGVGNTVSHSLVEGISRAGRGYSQIVNTAGNLQKKVMRMLKAAMTPHVNDWDIDWAGKPEKRFATLAAPAPRTVAPISLFDPNCDPDNTPFALPSSALTLTLPKVIQAPTVVPALFSYSRTTVYFLISNGDRPEKVFLKGSTHVASSNTICPLQIEIPVQAITSTGASLGLYQLAGRKLLQDLEEGRLSYLEGIYDKVKEPIKHTELISKEGTRVGVEFGLASKWTSFVAVAEDKSTGKGGANQQLGERTDVSAEGETQTTNSRSASSSSRGAAKEDQPAGRERANQHDRTAKRVSTSPRLQAQDYIYQQKQAQQAQMPQQQQQLPGGGNKGSGAPSKESGNGKIARASVSSPSRSQNFSSPTFSSSSGFSPSSSHGSPPTSQAFAPTSPRNATRRYSASSPSWSHNPVSDLATLPQSNGMFKADGRIFDLLGLRNCGLENVHADGDFVATVAVIVALEKKFPELSEEWEFMVSKAKEAVQKLYSEGDREAVVSAVRAALGV
ncbi:von Willebrand factor type A domain-domain-containing protein [Tuber borchii]|uniref:von Willebrand factor type A domain-domain-containing protein n=1 Tax=Tuber borchii TaxID=42251 RepID=A0A2T7A531_TUBBO|nr:von Willebrand factor type A domain-domain-containing protein [Tuber borchii]